MPYMEFSLVCNTTKTKRSQMSSNSKLERELLSIICHAYQLYYLPWLFMLSLYKAHTAEPSSYSVYSYGAHLPIILGRWLKTPATGKSFSLGTKYTFDSKIPLLFFKFNLQPQWLWEPDIRTIQLNFKVLFKYIICQPAAFHMPTPPHEQTLWKVLTCTNRPHFSLLPGG